ncbi:radical SAM protein [Clostridium luticellarii]|uniref:FO synthase subunit 2 n=1 Tax=Clostridium luticellarii TaxID=1691940 RepID=A0A2T0BPI9_9CLOT|nr:radical SAM protein [Clostridium luticellarii]PRR85798.1 FO synthase subunit 2 [Clostridium luticellarii]
MSNIKERLYKELEIKNKVAIDGVNVDPSIFKHIDLGGEYQEQIHTLFEQDHETHAGFNLPCGYTSPSGLKYSFRWDRKSDYSIEYGNGKYYLTYKENELFPIEFFHRPRYYNLKTSDGTSMSTVATYNQDGAIFVSYSNECALKDKGLDCLFCNINATKDTYAEKQNITWKYPKQIAETVAAAYKEGARHVTISGGFVPERREVDYYIDVAEAIQEYTGLEDFNGTGVIGAPIDLQVIDRYKEAGFRTIAMNLEIWDKNIYKAICPGKSQQCGGWDHWVKALEYGVKVFGYGRVRCGFVAGLEPKKSLLEGVEYMASKGIICLTDAWNPNPGSALEGHRTPEPEWHLDVSLKVYEIFKKAGFTFEQFYDLSPYSNFIVHDIYKIEDELLPVFNSTFAH